MTDQTLAITFAIAIGWPATLGLTYVATRDHWRHRLSIETTRTRNLTHELRDAHTHQDALTTQIRELDTALSDMALTAALRRPANPIVEWVALQGTATTTELCEQFGDGTADKLLQLLEAQEITCDHHGLWRWRHPNQRRGLTRPDPTETLEAPVWLPPPPQHRGRQAIDDTRQLRIVS